MIYKVIIILRRDFLYFRELVPWNRLKIMMLVMIPHIKSYNVKRTVIAVCFLGRGSKEMLLNPPGAERMKPYRESERGCKIKEGHPAESVNDKNVEAEYYYPIQDSPYIHEIDLFEP